MLEQASLLHPGKRGIVSRVDDPLVSTTLSVAVACLHQVQQYDGVVIRSVAEWDIVHTPLFRAHAAVVVIRC